MNDRRDYTWPTFAFSKSEYDFFCQTFSKHKQYIGNKVIYIFGAGIRGCMFLKFFQMLGVEIAGFVDNNMEKVGGYIGEYSILSLEEVLTTSTPSDYYIIISVESGEGIVRQLEKAKLKKDTNFCHIGSYLYKEFEEQFFAEYHDHELVMGDCILSNVAFSDISYKSLAELIIEKKENIKLLGMHGMPMATFYHLFRLQLRMNMRPRRLILFVNMVMFDGRKDILPRAQHPELLQSIQHRLPFMDKGFDKYVVQAEERFQKFNTDIFVQGKKQSDIRRNEQIQKMHFKMNYMYQLDVQNESLMYLQKLAQLAEENHVGLLLYIAPINYERGCELIGDGIKDKHQEHMDVIRSVLQPYQYQLCDVSFELGKSLFATQDTTNEITNWSGRLKEMELLLKYDD